MNPLISGRMRSGIPALVAIVLLAHLPVSLHAQGGGDAAADAPSASKGIDLKAFVSASYSYNANNPSNRRNGFRVFDFDAGDFKIDVAELVLQHVAERPGDAGFRADVAFGASIPRVTASRGLFRDAGGAAQDVDLLQGYVTYLAPIGEGLRMDLGKFVTPHGYELIEGPDGYNDNATHSFMFGYAIPATHTGLRLAYKASPEFGAMVMLMNGWDVVRDNNNAKSVCAQITLAPADNLSLMLAYAGGAERDTNDSDLRHVVDLVATWKITDRFSLGVNTDYGTEANAVTAGENAVWKGVAAYAKLTVAEPFTLALRGEYFEDHDGARTGLPQILKELTLTPEYHPAKNIAVRADLRMDFSTENVFDKDGTPSNRQPTVLLNAVFTY